MTAPITITLITSAGAVRVAGENLVIDIRDIPETPATSSQPVTAPEPSTSSPEARAPHSDGATAEACAGGPVSAQATPSKPIVHDLTLPAFLDRRAQRSVRHG